MGILEKIKEPATSSTSTAPLYFFFSSSHMSSNTWFLFVPGEMLDVAGSLIFSNIQLPHIWGWTPAFLNILLHVSIASRIDNDDSPSKTGSFFQIVGRYISL